MVEVMVSENVFVVPVMVVLADDVVVEVEVDIDVTVVIAVMLRVVVHGELCVVYEVTGHPNGGLVPNYVL
jgi:hypothetical protein